MPLELLAAADLHLGRRPTRLPEALTGRIPARELGPAGALERLVDLAIEEEVHALLLAGDVVEGRHDFFEAYRELRDAVVRLLEADVRVLAVAGNHDTRVLPRLADELEGFELLGRGGAWEAATLSGGGEEATVWGWSFPAPAVRENPLADHRFERGPGANLGLLHCDRDQAGSRYAPVPTRSLESTELDAWLLGHVHRPDELSTPRPAGYLGSLTGLDPGEPDRRGPWRVTVEATAVRDITHVPLGPLRWVAEDVSLEGLEEPEEARVRVLERLREIDRAIVEERTPPRAVGVRLTFTGRTRFRREVEELFAREELDDLRVGDGGVHYFVETHRSETLPEVDLEELARQSDPAGLLARRLLVLERDPGDPDREELVRAARRRLERAARDASWERLEAEPPGRDETAARLRRAGRKALDLLLQQKESR